MRNNKILKIVRANNPENPMQFLKDSLGDYLTDKVSEQITNCKECSIHDFKKNIPHGNINASVLIIGNAPEEDNDSGLALAGGNTKDILDKVMYGVLSVNKEELFFSNAVNCMPYKDIASEKLARIPTKKELSNCKDYINYIIHTVQPLAIIILGSVALSTFEPNRTIIKDRGEWLSISGIPAIATFHPDYFIKAISKDPEIISQQKHEFVSDINKVIEFIEENYEHIPIRIPEKGESKEND